MKYIIKQNDNLTGFYTREEVNKDYLRNNLKSKNVLYIYEFPKFTIESDFEIDFNNFTLLKQKQSKTKEIDGFEELKKRMGLKW